jgi:hypothetical protein
LDFIVGGQHIVFRFSRRQEYRRTGEQVWRPR